MTTWKTVLTTLVVAGLVGCTQQADDDVGQTQEGDLVLGPAEAVNTIERAVAPGDRPLMFTGFNGTVRLNGADTDVARLTFTERGRGQDESAARDVLDGVRLVERGNANRYEYVMRSDQPERSEVDVRGTIPREAAVQIGFESGAVALSGVMGPIDIEHQSGNVQIAGAGNSVRVAIRNGSIQLALQQLPDDAEVTLRTANGDLTLAVPESASAELTAQTQAGPINVQDLRFASRQLDPQGAGSRFEARLGGGAARVDLQTENGAITLRGQRPEPLVPADSMTIEPVDTTQAATSDTIPPPGSPTLPDTAEAAPSVTPPPDTIGTSDTTDMDMNEQ